jgi:alpha-1,2-mannosyltransferase
MTNISHMGRVIFFVCLASLLGWPFGVLTAVPVGLQILIRYARTCRLQEPVVHGIKSVVVVVGASVAVDWLYYKRILVPIVNIAIYNSMGTGAERYGVEPWHWYVKNLLLNFNVVAILAVCLPLAAALHKMSGAGAYVHEGEKKAQNPTLLKGSIGCVMVAPELLYAMPWLVWLCVMAPQPHKEERFFFIVYPVVCYAGALSVVLLKQACLMGAVCMRNGRSVGRLFKVLYSAVVHMLLVAVVCLGVSRAVALSAYYRAPLQVYGELSSVMARAGATPDTLVCVGKEWYRFPNHFFLPNNARLGFLPSDFGGQLPQHYPEATSVFDATSQTPPNFNQENEMEPSRFVSHATDCAYIVDLDMQGQTEPHFQEGTHTAPATGQAYAYRVVSKARFLDVDATPSAVRAFYLPDWVWERVPRHWHLDRSRALKASWLDYIALERYAVE